MKFPTTSKVSFPTAAAGSLFDKFFGEFFTAPATPTSSAHSAPVNVAESPTELTIEFELPGVLEQDIDIEVLGNRLSVRAKREFRAENREYHAVEHRYGSMARQIELPRGLDADAIHATFENGVLRIHVPKSEKLAPRKVAINARETTA